MPPYSSNEAQKVDKDNSGEQRKDGPVIGSDTGGWDDFIYSDVDHQASSGANHEANHVWGDILKKVACQEITEQDRDGRRRRDEKRL